MVIGVAFVVGTLVFTDTIDASFKNLFERTQQGVDVAIEARQAVKADFSVAADDARRRRSTRSRRRPGVDVAEGSVSGDGTLLDKQGEAIVSNGPPTLLVSTSTNKIFQSLDYAERRSARRPTTRSRSTAAPSKKYGFKVGDTVTVSSDAPAQAVQGLRHRHARRQGQPRRRPAGRDDRARRPSG